MSESLAQSFSAPRPQGAYIPAAAERLRAGDILITSAGMTPRVDGRLTATGLVGRDLDIARARDAAALAVRNAAAAMTLGDLGCVRRWMRMTVYVACADGFTELTAVADGASEALDELVPGMSRPARSAIGVRALPGGAPVEIELTALARDTAAPARPAVPLARAAELIAEAIDLLGGTADADERAVEAIARVIEPGVRTTGTADSSVEDD